MATNLFGKYFDNPTKSYIYTNLQCNGASADEISFDINGSNGVISDNGNVLGTIDLSQIHVPITQYTNEMRIINPYSFIYIRGIDYGDSYTSKSYGKIIKKFIEDEDWMYKTTAFFGIKYLNDCGIKKTLFLAAEGSIEEDKTFIDAIQETFDKEKIYIDVTFEDGYVKFTASRLGYDFWIDHLLVWKSRPKSNAIEEIKHEYNQYGLGYDDEWIDDNDVPTDDVFASKSVYTNIITQKDYQAVYDLMTYLNSQDNNLEEENRFRCIFLFEDICKYVPPKKYRNGAMLGCVVVATYPIFNAENIPETQRSLRIGHMVNRVADYNMIPSAVSCGVPLAVKKIRDVVDTYHSEYEYDLFNKWSNEFSQINTRDEWIDPEEIPHVIPEMISKWEHSHVPTDYVASTIYRDMNQYDAIGVYGYCTYMTKHNLWLPMGQVYLRTTVPDDESKNTRNLIPSFIVYNPNPFPVTVKYMTFA